MEEQLDKSVEELEYEFNHLKNFLLPCPFCGGEGNFIEYWNWDEDQDDHKECCVICKKCQAKSNHQEFGDYDLNEGFLDKLKVIKLWNKRV